MYRLVVVFALAALASADVSHLFNKPSTQILTPFQNVKPVAYHAPQGLPVIVKQSQDATPDGNYHWGFQSDNGIQAEEKASFRKVGENVAPAVEGSYSYTSPEGQVVSVKYVADENGYRAEGSHIPTPPPIPAAILRALEWIKAHPYKTQERVF